MMWMC
jgi:hypothetical protein